MFSARLPARVAVPAAVSTGAASAVWTAAILALTLAGRFGAVGVLLAGELGGSLLSRWFAVLSPRLRYIAAVLLYTGTRAVLIPLIVMGAPMVAVFFVCLCSGACWRVLVSQFSVSSLLAPWRSHSRQIAWVSAFSTTGALVGTMVAGRFYAAPASVWVVVSLLILVALAVPVAAAGGLSGDVSQIVRLIRSQLTEHKLAGHVRVGEHAPVSRLPVALLAASFVTTVASTALPRLGVVIVALVASPAWVGPASLFAALAAVVVPLVVGRADGWSLGAVSAFSVLSAAVWLVAPVGVVVVVCGAVSSFVGGVVDGQVDSRAAVGPDPAASLARLQTAQALVAAGTGLVVAPMLDVLSPASLAAAVSGFVLLGTCVVAYIESRFRVA